MSGHELAMALRAAYLAMHRRTDDIMATIGITADQFVVLAALSEGEALTQRDLVERTSSDPNTLRAMLVLLESKELVERKPHPTDGRARSVSLTTQGRAIFRKAWRRTETLRRELIEALASDETGSFTANLHQLAEMIGNRRAVKAIEES